MAVQSSMLLGIFVGRRKGGGCLPKCRVEDWDCVNGSVCLTCLWVQSPAPPKGKQTNLEELASVIPHATLHCTKVCHPHVPFYPPEDYH